jgi:hypothetical protein
VEKRIGASAVRYAEPNSLVVANSRMVLTSPMMPNSRMVSHSQIAVPRRQLVSPDRAFYSSQKNGSKPVACLGLDPDRSELGG